MTAPLATIIVVAHNSARWLERQRAALEAQTERRWRLIVIDNASRPEERPKQTQLPAGATLIQSECNLGFAAANNLAAAEADTPYLIFLNPDAFPEPTWLAALVNTADRVRVAGAVGSTQIRADAPSVLDGLGDEMHAIGIAYRSGYGKPRGVLPPLRETFSACAAAMLVRRTVFESVGGFDERFFCFFEDVDLGFRLRLLGHSVVQSPDAVVAHVGGGSAGTRSPFAEFHGARNRVWTFLKCMPGPLLWPMLPAHLLASIILCAVGPLRGRGYHALRGFFAALADLGPAFAERCRIQGARRARTLDIARSLAWSPDVLLTRRPVLRRIRGTCSTAPGAWAERSAPCPRPPRDRLAR